jgi:hypothetical protein
MAAKSRNLQTLGNSKRNSNALQTQQERNRKRRRREKHSQTRKTKPKIQVLSASPGGQNSRSRSQNMELFPLILHTEWGLWFYQCTTVVMVNPRPLWLHSKIDQKTNTQLHRIFPVFSSHGLNLPYELPIHLSCQFWPNRDICKVTLLEKPTQPIWPKLMMGLKCIRSSLGGKK